MSHRKQAPEQLGDVLILGLGKSGRACASYLLDLLGRRVRSVTIAAGASNDQAVAWADARSQNGLRVYFDDETITGSYDLCIASPGISQFSPFYQAASNASAEIVSEVEFAWRESAADSRWIAITGTNGKTTTTALTAALLQASGLNASAVGNIGDTCLEAVAAGKTDVYVAEVSSYQLASTVDFAPDVAVVLNITPDHLSWHRSLDAYEAAKWKILENLSRIPGSVAVLNAVDDRVRSQVRKLRQQTLEERGFDYIPLGTKAGIQGDMRAACGAKNAAFIDQGHRLVVAYHGVEYQSILATQLQLKGSHNLVDALAAVSVAVSMGADLDSVNQALAAFPPLEHRIEPVGSINGVACYNDSKATNVDATLVALSAFDPIRPIILLGGRDKGTELQPLVQACHQHVKAVVLYGESESRFRCAFDSFPSSEEADQLSGSGDSSPLTGASASPAGEAPAGESTPLEVVSASDMEHALDAALEMAVEGDVILLSPACASFDAFRSFEERGDVFRRLVAERSRHPVPAPEDR